MPLTAHLHMARDNLFFERAGALHPVYRTPVFGLVAQAIWTMVLCLSGTYSELLNYVVFAALIFYLLTTVSLFRLRRLRPDLPRPVKAFGYPILPALCIAAIAFLLVVLLADPQQRKFSALGLLIVALGIPVFLAPRKVGPSGPDGPRFCNLRRCAPDLASSDWRPCLSQGDPPRT